MNNAFRSMSTPKILLFILYEDFPYRRTITITKWVMGIAEFIQVQEAVIRLTAASPEQGTWPETYQVDFRSRYDTRFRLPFHSLTACIYTWLARRTSYGSGPICNAMPHVCIRLCSHSPGSLISIPSKLLEARRVFGLEDALRSGLECGWGSVRPESKGCHRTSELAGIRAVQMFTCSRTRHFAPRESATSKRHRHPLPRGDLSVLRSLFRRFSPYSLYIRTSRLTKD
jgi:hypothetical protein